MAHKLSSVAVFSLELSPLSSFWGPPQTIIPPYPSKDGDEARQLLTNAGLPLFKRGIKSYSVFQKASLNGVVVSEVNDSKAGIAWSDYKATGKEIIEEIV